MAPEQHGEGRDMRRIAASCLSALLAPCVVLLANARPASAAVVTVYGPEERVTFNYLDLKGLSGWSCEFVGYYVATYENAPSAVYPEYQVQGSADCRAGVLQADAVVTKVVLHAPDAGDSEFHCTLEDVTRRNIDDASERSFTFVAEMRETSNCYNEAGAPSHVFDLCITVDEGAESEYCKGFTPEFPQPGDASVVQGVCPRATLIPPYVTEPTTFGSAGSWRWRRTVTFRIADKTALGTMQLGGVNVRLAGYIKTATASGLRLVGTATPAQRVNVGGSNSALAVSFDHDSSLAVSASVTEVSVTIESDTLQGGAVGSTSPLEVTSAGYYASPVDGVQAVVGMGVNSTETQPSESTWAGSASSAGTWAGHQTPEWCYAAWGNDAATGAALSDEPLPGGPAGSTPPPYEAPRTSAPTYDAPVAPPPADPSANPLPDPEGAECDFSFTDPSTWGGQLICALVQVAKAIIGAIGDVLGALASLVVDLLDGLLGLLKSLFIPTEGVFSGAIDTLRASFEGSPLGDWVAVFTPPGAGNDAPLMAKTATTSETQTLGPMALSGPTGSCQGPTVDLGSLGLSDHLVPTEPLHPFDACSGTAATVAENVRKWTAVGLSLGAAFKIFEMLLGAFGAARTVRIMASHEWTGPGSGRI